ncbi:MAG: glycosyltransferase family 4 protein [Candidatus Sericytochromatia bacterium]|nr:glycosyltransferase family 4 protein [Candidatus Sericytochromatia bacterium]
MSYRFISWLYFPFMDLSDEINLIKECCSELNINSTENNVIVSKIDTKKFNYNYLISEDQFENIDNNLLVINKPDEYIYVEFAYALKNIIRFVSNKEKISFEEIKGLNVMDTIFVPDSINKALLEKNHISKDKIIILHIINNNSTNQEKYLFKQQIKKYLLDAINIDHGYQVIFNSDDQKKLSYNDELNKIIKQIEPKSYIFIDYLDLLNDEQITNLINEKLNVFDYTILSSKSEIYSKKYRSKDYCLNLLKNFNIIQNTYYGSKELKFYQHEQFIIIIKNSLSKDERKFIIYEGSQFFHNSLSVINRELELQIINSKKYELSIIPRDYYQEIDKFNYTEFNKLQEYFNRILINKADFYIQHVLPSDYSAPEDGYYIMIIPWEYGKLPDNLVRHINLKVDQVWCPSNYVKKLHIQSGIIESKIVVIPNGINPQIFNSKITPLKLDSDKSFKFLFLGGIVYRKGVDILLEAYLEEFSKDEDVSLIIKGFGQNSYYKNESFTQKINEITNNKNNPEVIFIEHNIAIEDMGKIYTACNCYVHPYRGEGFGMPIFEAMASGLPVIVPNYGAVLDFCTDKNAYLIDYKLIETFDPESEEIITVCESDKNHLKKLMREAFKNNDKNDLISLEAIKIIDKLNWNNIFRLIEEQFYNLSLKPIFRKNIDFYIKQIIKEIEINTEQNNLSDMEIKIKQLENLCLDNFIYYEKIADLYHQIKNYKKALEYFAKIIKINPSKNIKEKLINTLNNLGDHRTAELLKNS